MLRVLVLLGALASPAAAEALQPSDASPAVTVSAGALLPVFLLYESPGPWVAASVAWPMSPRTQVVASADTGVLVAPGATRTPLSLGLGARLSPCPRVPLWLQLGMGVTAYVERIGVALPERTLRATDHGAALTADLAIGVRITPRWELAVSYDHQLVSSEPGSVAPRVSQPHETLPFVGTAMVSVGRRL